MRKNVARLIALLLALLMCTGMLLACNDEPSPEPTPDEQPETPDAPDTPDEPQPAPEEPSYRILIASDTHCTDLMDWYGVADEDRLQMWVDSVLAEHELQPFDLIIIAGDISLDTHAGETCYTKGYSTSEIFVEEYVSQLPEDVPVFILPGNHETIPEDDWVALTGNSRQCTTVVGNNTFIMLDTFANIEGANALEPPYTPVDVAYVKEQMEAYPENNVYLVAHTFPIDEGMGAESAAFREILCDERVIGLFGGHTHLNTIVQYNESCGNKIQAQTGNYSYTNGSYDTAFWGFRDLIITKDSATTSYIQATCEVVLGGEERSYERKLTEVVDFMNPPDFNQYVAADGTVYRKLYDYIDRSSIQGVAGQLNYPAVNLLDGVDHSEWFPLFDGNQQSVISWEMTEEVEVLAYVLVTGFHDTNCIPVSWTLYAGDSYSLLEPIDVQEKAIMPSTTRTHSQVFTIDPDNVGYYQYYRLVFTGNATGSPGYLATSPGYEASELILLAAEE
jgi:hypothetical protein